MSKLSRGPASWSRTASYDGTNREAGVTLLRQLHVRNLAVIEEASVDFEPGLNVVTGETGAGKTLVVDSLNLLGGARASADLVRTGADQMTVTGVFEMPNKGRLRDRLERAGIECDAIQSEGLLIRREVARSGRNRVFVNDQPATLRLLTDVAGSLLRIHGQRDELGLADAELQRSWVDRQGGAAGERALAACSEAFDAYRVAAEQLRRIVSDDRARLERNDLLRFQSSEIQQAHLVPGEEVELRAERDRLRHAEEIGGALARAFELLSEDDGATSRMARAQAALNEIVRWEQDADEWLSELEDARIRLEEIIPGLRNRLGRIEADPARLNALEDRLATLERLFRKYGATSKEVIARGEAIASELAELEVDEGRLAELHTEAARLLEEYQTAALELSRRRRRWARALEKRIGHELAELALGKARFEVELSTRIQKDSPLLVAGEPTAFNPWGYDTVTFFFSSNPGEETRPLAKVASGGELSRVYLALQTAAHGAGSADQATLVFDEVDSGVGGAAAAVVGRKLCRLAAGGQILAVTHLPQVACQGHHHYRVQKSSLQGRTSVVVERLSAQLRTEEVARMLGGEEVTTLALQHAAELLADVDQSGVDESHGESGSSIPVAAKEG